MSTRIVESHSCEGGICMQLELVSCGSSRCAKCRENGPSHGPYWYAYCKCDGRTLTCYVGRELDEAKARAGIEAARARQTGERPLTAAQMELLQRLEAQGGSAFVRGPEVSVARRLQARGLVTLEDNGPMRLPSGRVDSERWLVRVAS